MVAQLFLHELGHACSLARKEFKLFTTDLCEYEEDIAAYRSAMNAAFSDFDKGVNVTVCFEAESMRHMKTVKDACKKSWFEEGLADMRFLDHWPVAAFAWNCSRKAERLHGPRRDMLDCFLKDPVKGKLLQKQFCAEAGL
jgi:hypothetical protein